MSRDKSKLTKAAQTAQTRRAILDHARQLFASQGYAATGTEEIIAGLGITRGALYHQFGNKQGVFQAVIEEAFLEIAQYIATQAQMVDAPWAQLVQGLPCVSRGGPTGRYPSVSVCGSTSCLRRPNPHAI